MHMVRMYPTKQATVAARNASPGGSPLTGTAVMYGMNTQAICASTASTAGRRRAESARSSRGGGGEEDQRADERGDGDAGEPHGEGDEAEVALEERQAEEHGRVSRDERAEPRGERDAGIGVRIGVVGGVVRVERGGGGGGDRRAEGGRATSRCVGTHRRHEGAAVAPDRGNGGRPAFESRRRATTPRRCAGGGERRRGGERAGRQRHRVCEAAAERRGHRVLVLPRIVTALHTIYQCHGNCDVRECSGSRFETVCSTLGPAEGAKDTPFAAPRTRPPTPPFFIHHSRCLSVRP